VCVHEYTHTQTCVRFEAGSVCKCIIETHCAIPLPDFPHHEICISGGVSKGCIFIRVCARLCISETCVPVHEHLFVCVYMCKFLHMRMCIFACVGLCKRVLCGCVAQTFTCACTCTRKSTHLCKDTRDDCNRAHEHVQSQVHVYVRTCVLVGPLVCSGADSHRLLTVSSATVRSKGCSVRIIRP